MSHVHRLIYFHIPFLAACRPKFHETSHSCNFQQFSFSEANIFALIYAIQDIHQKHIQLYLYNIMINNCSCNMYKGTQRMYGNQTWQLKKYHGFCSWETKQVINHMWGRTWVGFLGITAVMPSTKLGPSPSHPGFYR